MPRATLDKNPSDVAAMFDGVASRYDITNAVLSFGQDRRWRAATVRALEVAPGQRVLDLAAGTGTSSAAVADAGARVVAADLSAGMIEEGRKRYPSLEFVEANATDLPFADNEFDAVTISFGLRNVSDTDKALTEMLRVTRPGGRLVICEFSTPTWTPWRVLYQEYLMRALPVVAGVLTSDAASYEYLAESIRAWPAQRDLGVQLKRAGWQNVHYRNLSGGIVALHRGIAPQ